MKSALITGASRGLGLSLAKFLAAQSYQLIITARNQAALKKQADVLVNLGAQVSALAGDITDPAHREELIQACKSYGELDLLFNNASHLGPSPQPPLADYPLEQLRNVYETNVLAPLALIQKALPLHPKLIVNISSDAAIAAYETWGGYGSSKAALDLLSATLAKELRSKGVSVVSVDPGDMRTQMHQEAFPNEDISDRPLPEVTLAFWAWLLGQDPHTISGQRYRAQADTWLKEAAL